MIEKKKRGKCGVEWTPLWLFYLCEENVAHPSMWGRKVQARLLKRPTSKSEPRAEDLRKKVERYWKKEVGGTPPTQPNKKMEIRGLLKGPRYLKGLQGEKKRRKREMVGKLCKTSLFATKHIKKKSGLKERREKCD